MRNFDKKIEFPPSEMQFSNKKLPKSPCTCFCVIEWSILLIFISETHKFAIWNDGVMWSYYWHSFQVNHNIPSSIYFVPQNVLDFAISELNGKRWKIDNKTKSRKLLKNNSEKEMTWRLTWIRKSGSLRTLPTELDNELTTSGTRTEYCHLLLNCFFSQ